MGASATILPDADDTNGGEGDCREWEEDWTELHPERTVEEFLDEEGNVRPEACRELCGPAPGDASESGGLTCAAESSDEGETETESTGGQGTGGSGSTGGHETGTTGETSSATDSGSSNDDTSGGEPLVEVQCTETLLNCMGGRGHAALRSTGRANATDPVGRWAASCAHAEAASVPAFVGLARELEAHGAPKSLQMRALQAAREEVTHAKMMCQLARDRGAEVPPPRFDRITVRDLETIATENAVEGCVRETWAALEASYQGQHALSPHVRAAMTRIAADETRHAELARDIDGWCRSRLDPAANARVNAARSAAAARLLARNAKTTNESVRRHLGLPNEHDAALLKQGLHNALWS